MQAASFSLTKVPGTQRVVTAEQTLERAVGVARDFGVTRLADVTGLDRIGIPVYSAMVPHSDDYLSVYNGKGARAIDAKAGALMEAIERQTALKARLPLVEGSVRELRNDYSVLDPRSMREKLRPEYTEERTYSWVEGEDFVSGRKVLVPAKYVGYCWDDVPHPSCFNLCSSNGLASGNVREEAICQGLCELIERDAWTLAEIGSHYLPWARYKLVQAAGRRSSGAFGNSFTDDFEICPRIEVDDESTQRLVDLFERAGIHPVVHDMTSDLGIPSVFVAVADDVVPGFPMVHWGIGTHPDARVAARRALTEAAQSRCVDIQGVREDIMPSDTEISAVSRHTRRARTIDRSTWHLGESKRSRTLSELPSAVHDDVQADLDHLLSRLTGHGVDQVIVVYLTPPDAPFAVVRMIVPGLETWALQHGHLGKRAMKLWRDHA